MRHLLVLLLVGCLMPAATAVAGEPTTPQQVAAAAARKVVKIYGAGGVQGLEGYQSGLIISPDGRIATAMSTVLDSEGIDCVLDDGRRFEATLLGVDPRRELAVLTIDAADLLRPCLRRSVRRPARGCWRYRTCLEWPSAMSGRVCSGV